MNDIQKALADIGNIRQHLAGGSLFRGFGPPAIALTGLLALGAAGAQSAFGGSTDGDRQYYGVWIGLAVLCAAIIGIEMWRRARLHHGMLADAMLINAVEAFVPSGAAGLALALVIFAYAPESSWMLPGLWQLTLSLGVFAAVRFLPKPVVVVAAWYFLTGVAVLIYGSETRSSGPWSMGIPFGFGQLLLAAILRQCGGSNDDV